MDGFNIMVRITRISTNFAILGFVAFLLIMPIFNTTMFGISSSEQERMPKITPSLQTAIEDALVDDMIPVTVQFDSTYNQYLIAETLSKARL